LHNFNIIPLNNNYNFSITTINYLLSTVIEICKTEAIVTQIKYGTNAIEASLLYGQIAMMHQTVVIKIKIISIDDKICDLNTN